MYKNNGGEKLKIAVQMIAPVVVFAVATGALNVVKKMSRVCNSVRLF